MGTLKGWETRRRNEAMFRQRVALLAADQERDRIRDLAEKMAGDPVSYFSTPRGLSQRHAQRLALLELAKRL